MIENEDIILVDTGPNNVIVSQYTKVSIVKKQ